MTERRLYRRWRPFIGGEIGMAALVAEAAGPML
jgi:hypothetical protein